MLSVERATVSYSDTPVFSMMDFELAPGELVAIVGENGAGKSTLGRVLCASQLVDEGRVTVEGHDPSFSELERLHVRELVGYVQQDPSDQLVSSLVFDEVAFGPRNLDLTDGEIAERVSRSLDAVGLAGFEHRVTTELSGGEQQRLALAGALAMRPRYLVLDEPTAQLDPASRASMRELFRRLASEEQLGVALITHDPLEMALADRVVECGSRCGDASDLPETPTMRPAIPELKADASTLLQMHDVSFSYQERVVLRGVDLEVRGGEVVLLIGASGAGKSTLASLAAGLVEPSYGTVRVCGQVARPGLAGIAFQNPESQFFLDTVYDELAFAPRNFGASDADVDARVREASQLVGLGPELLDRYPFELSGGQARRVALASMLTLDAPIYVLDEPSAGLDARGRAFAYAFVRDLAARGKGVVVISHDVDEWSSVANRTLCLMDGELRSLGSNGSEASRIIQTEPAPPSRQRGASACETGEHARKTPHRLLGGSVADAPLARVDARVKILLLLVVSMGIFLASNPVGLAIWFALLAACFAAARMNPLDVVCGMRPILIVLAFTLLANLVSCDGHGAIKIAGAVGLSPEGGLRGLIAVVRIVLLVGFALSVAATTTATQIAEACVSLLRPLTRIGVPVSAIGLALSLALRCIPLVSDELMRIRMAQRARGAHFDEGGLAQRIRVWGSVLMPLMAGLFRRADRLGEAMAARCYGAADYRAASRLRDERA